SVKLSYRVSWICLLLFSIGTCFPIDSPRSSPGYDSAFSPGVAYSGSSGPGSASSSGGAAPSSGGGAGLFGLPFVPGMSFLRHLIPHRLFPDANAWDTDEVPLGMIEPPAVAPSSYIIQSSNGYQRARELLSHSKYSPDIFDHFLLPPIVTQTPQHKPKKATTYSTKTLRS
uniref:Uncharacterized protein n=1 Tax=Acanthochromis polyacanthus TaxID=80966 RepID=A0A3Q1GUG7_9TELE